MKHREYSVEVFRIIMMFGICFLHAISFGRLGTPIYNSAAMFCVNGFVLISGYFGCKFRISKVISLYAVAAWCIAVGLFAKVYVGGETLQPGFCDLFLREFKGYWFLHAYVALMLTAPLFDLALNSPEVANRRRLWAVAAPFIFLVFGWGWMQTLGRSFFGDAAKYFPPIPGYSGGGYAYLVLAGTYVAGRVVRKLEPFNLPAKILSVAGILLCYVATTYLPAWLKINSRLFACYCSPFVLMMAVFAFIAIKAVKFPKPLGVAACWVAPSLFAVYLLHTTKFGFGMIRTIVQNMSSKGMDPLLAYVTTAAILLIGCIALDLPRRLMFSSVAFLVRRIFRRKPPTES